MDYELKTVYLSLGANLGDKRATIDEAITLIDKQICCLTTLTPQEVLRTPQAIERALGRTQMSVDGNYHDRTIDIDILLYDDIRIDTPELTIPHPLMYERDFVMMPLREIMLNQC